jgi:predicted Zn-dependent peptidase
MQAATLTNIVPVTKVIDGRNVCIISNPEANMTYASVMLRGGYYTENRRSELGITHLIEHILFESWQKCYGPDSESGTKSKSKSKSKCKSQSKSKIKIGKTLSVDSISHASESLLLVRGTKTSKTSKTRKTKTTAPKKSCLHFWNNRPVRYNGVTNYQQVGAYIYGLASESDNIVDYITQMLCSCSNHLNLEMLDHVKNTVLNEMTGVETDPMSKLVYEVTRKHIDSNAVGASGAFKMHDTAVQIENLKRITPEHIRHYYYSYFIPENAVFLYAGRVTETQIRRITARHLGGSHTTAYGSVATISIPRPIGKAKVATSTSTNTTTKTPVKFITSKLFSDKFTNKDKCGTSGSSHSSSRSRKINMKDAMVVINPAVQSAAMFCILLPAFPDQRMGADFQHIRKAMFYRIREIQVLQNIISSELLELLRHRQNLVYSINASYSVFTGANVLQISGTCLPKDVDTVIHMCINYIRERQTGAVPATTLSAVKGRFKMSTYASSSSVPEVCSLFENAILRAMISNGNATVSSIMKNASFISYNAAVKEIDSVSVSGIMAHFASICIENAVSGYSIRGKLKT